MYIHEKVDEYRSREVLNKSKEKTKSFFEGFHDVWLFTELSELFDHVEFLLDVAFIVFELDCFVLSEISFFMLSSGNVVDISEFFPGSPLQNLGSAGIKPRCYFYSFCLYVSVFVSNRLVLEIYFHCWIN